MKIRQPQIKQRSLKILQAYYYEQLYSNKFYNPDANVNFQEKHKMLKLTLKKQKS